MTFGRMVVAIVALVAAFALGVWAGPYLIDKPVTSVQQAADETKDAAVPVPTTGRARAERPARAAREEAPVATLAASAPELQKQLKPIMNKGTDMEIAAQGFRDGEQFAMLAHAARNTEIPFVVLKDRVLEQKKSLASAIEEFKPQLNGAAEATRAREAARRDIAGVMTDRRAQAQTAER
jgi:hypothetical protein